MPFPTDLTTSQPPPGALALPGAVGISHLRVYDWDGPDGACGGSAHVHLLCTEAYVVAAGSGSLQTLGGDGFTETPLRAGSVVWFTPGTIHRAVNHGGLEVFVVMQNAGLPEAGDFVLTFPPDVLADPDRYAEMASLAEEGRVFASGEEKARRRKDLAVEGFLELKERVLTEGPEALGHFYADALKLVAPRLPDFERRWEEGAAAAAGLTRERLEALRAGDTGHLHAAATRAAEPPPERFGLCGHLAPYDA